MNITVRRMRRKDIPAVSMVLCICYRFLARREGFTARELKALIKERGSVKSMREQCKEYQFLVAVLRSKVVGTAAIVNNEIEKLYVAPKHHGKRVGKALFKAAERLIKKAGHKTLELRTTGYGLHFYKTMGMSVSGRSMLPKGPLKGRKIVVLRKKI